MQNTIKLSVLLISLGVVLSPLAAQELTGMPAQIDANGTAYVSGGVGDKELEQVNLASKDYNLKLILAEKSGAYAADVKLVIVDRKGKPVLDLPSAGPIVLTRLAPAKYRIRAIYEGQEAERVVSLIAGRQKTLTFLW